LAEALMDGHYDPRYLKSRDGAGPRRVIDTAGLAEADLAVLADRIAAKVARLAC
jgi:hypothetical protein